MQDDLKNYLVKISDSIDEYNKFRLATIQALINEQNLSNDELKIYVT